MTEGHFIKEKPPTCRLENGEGEGLFEFSCLGEKEEDETKNYGFYVIHYDYNYETRIDNHYNVYERKAYVTSF